VWDPNSNKGQEKKKKLASNKENLQSAQATRTQRPKTQKKKENLFIAHSQPLLTRLSSCCNTDTSLA
jgi:hypothetical protein